MCNTANIYPGQVFPSYKRLCEVLEEPYYKGGDQKTSQMRRWKEFFQYKKDGQSIEILQVFGK